MCKGRLDWKKTLIKNCQIFLAGAIGCKLDAHTLFVDIRMFHISDAISGKK